MASTLKVDTITTPDGTGNITVSRPIVADVSNVTGTLPAISGANLTNLNATNLASGTVPTARLGSGTANSTTFLRGDQTYAEAGGGSWVLIGTQEASTSASLTQTGLGTAYEAYAIIISDMHPTTHSTNLWIRVGDSSGIDSGASDYEFHCHDSNPTGNTYGALSTTGESHIQASSAVGNAGGQGVSGMYYLIRPYNGQVNPVIMGPRINVNASTQIRVGNVFGMRKSAITLDRVQVLFSSGNISVGRMSVYGIAHA